MTHRLLSFLAVIFVALSMNAQAQTDIAEVQTEAPLDTSAPYPDASELLRSVVESFPAEPVDIKAQLQSKKASGEIEKTVNVDLRLNWNSTAPSARYTVFDAFGAHLEGLNVRYNLSGPISYKYFKGSPLIAAPEPDLFSPIQATDVSWIDLSLSFLWWSGGKTVGTEQIKGRSCYLIDLPVPTERKAPFAIIRLWIDPRIRILLQAVAYTKEGTPVRAVQVKSFKKVRGLWVIQNLDVLSYPSRHKTALRVREVKVAGENVQ